MTCPELTLTRRDQAVATRNFGSDGWALPLTVRAVSL